MGPCLSSPPKEAPPLTPEDPLTTRAYHQPHTMDDIFDEVNYHDWKRQSQMAVRDLTTVKRFLEGLGTQDAENVIPFLGHPEKFARLSAELVPLNADGDAVGTPYNPEEDQEEDEEEDTQEEVQPDVAPDPLADEMGGLNIGNGPVGDENPPVIGGYIPRQNLRVANWVEGLPRHMYNNAKVVQGARYLTARGKLFPHPRYEEAVEWAKSKNIPLTEYDGEKELCPIPNCPQAGFRYSVKGNNKSQSNLLQHIRRQHEKLMFLSREECPELDADKGRLQKCGCDGNGTYNFSRDGFSNFDTYIQHLSNSVLHNPDEGEEIRRRRNADIAKRSRRQSTN